MAPRSLSEINQQAIRLLVRELGSADAARFSRQFTTGYGDYTKERKELFKDWTLEAIGAAIEATRDTSRPTPPIVLGEDALPSAWRKLLQEKEALLIDLIADQVESLYGYKPNPETVVHFLNEDITLTERSSKKTEK